ncbi:putative Nucleosome assembly protein (NAP) [Blattamonas nauphoetae]|uniref:Nucleosome assembly protein (NAP) n=1 Tax=Blattamonas nauphoetae TaxID=2049346 RepID=A0ABQ9YLB7_9EUKA|nr:putative Nucleosome assembly protein (NAP) [Blattamonas nauphoetae]
MSTTEDRGTETTEETPTVENVTASLESAEVSKKDETKTDGQSDSDSDSDDGLTSFIMYTPAMKHRISGAKKVYNQIIEVLTQQQKEKNEIVTNFNERKASIQQKRREIILGDYEPTDADLAPSKELPFKDPEAADKDTSPAKEDDGKGIKNFWKTCIMNSSVLSQNLHQWDEDALNYLKDMTVRRYILEDEKKDSFEPNIIYEACLTFEENPYFSNTELKRSVKVQMMGGQMVSFYDGDEDDLPTDDTPSKPQVQTIQWKEGKEIGVRTEKKKVKDKKTKKKVVKERRIVRPSFFDLFITTAELENKVDVVVEHLEKYPPSKAELHGDKDAHEDEDEGDDDECDCHGCHNKIGLYEYGFHNVMQLFVGFVNTIVLHIVPHAFEYFAGLVQEGEDSDDDDDDDDLTTDSEDTDSDTSDE